MIKHIVFWKLKDGALGAEKAENAQRLQRGAEDLAGIVDGMGTIELGINFDQGAEAFDVALYSEFENREALAAYQAHPAHKAFAELVGQVREVRAVVDYEV